MGDDTAWSENDVWRSRRRRTARLTLDPAGKPYNRGDFVRRVEGTVGIQELEAVGPTQDPTIWELTFLTTAAADTFISAGDFTVRGRTATVQGADNQLYRLRIHWVPYYVPHGVFVEALAEKGAKVMTAEFDTSTVKGLEHVKTGIRTFSVQTSCPVDIPHLIPFLNGHEEREALVTMSGRLPLCLRCRQSGHVRQQCTVPFCWRCRTYGHRKKDCKGRTYAAVASGEPAHDEPLDHSDDEEESHEHRQHRGHRQHRSDERKDDQPTATKTSDPSVSKEMEESSAPPTSTKESSAPPTSTEESSAPPSMSATAATTQHDGNGTQNGSEGADAATTSVFSQWAEQLDERDRLQALEAEKVKESDVADSSAIDGFEDALSDNTNVVVRRRTHSQASLSSDAGEHTPSETPTRNDDDGDGEWTKNTHKRQNRSVERRGSNGKHGMMPPTVPLSRRERTTQKDAASFRRSASREPDEAKRNRSTGPTNRNTEHGNKENK